LEGVNGENQILIKEFYQYMQSRGSRSEHHARSLLNLLIAFDKFLKRPFTLVDKKEEILAFLDHQYVDGKWVKREHDAEGKYINSWNLYLALLRIFFQMAYK
jgi:hypothetical protein